jgi:cytoskeleton protein RodZ
VTGSVDTQSGAPKAGSPSTSASAGATLKAAREAAGLSVDAVAQQLKLAPRQVHAIEADDYQHLPGRTFVRGFARNYARFLHLDADAVLALLPGGESAPALERPTLAPTRRPMGELPVEGVARRSAIRWLIPVVLLLAVAAAGYYEYMRQQAALRAGAAGAATAGPGNGAATTAPAVLPAPATSTAAPQGAAAGEPATPGATPPAPSAPGTRSTPLPNPLAAPPTADSPPQQPMAPGVPDAGAAPRGSGAAGADGRSAAAGDGAPLFLAFKGRSWVEVRDGGGRVVLQSTETAGATRAVSARPPIELAVGDARQVDVTYRGQPLDLGPYTRGNVARVSLK